MKKLLFIVWAFVCLSFVTYAQPVLTAADLNPVVGDYFLIIYSDTVFTGSAGADQTWDLTAMSNAGSSVANVLPAAASAQADSFPLANIIIQNVWIDTTEEFYVAGTDALQYAGTNVVTFNIAYYDLLDRLQYPLTYNSTFSDTGSAIYYNNFEFHHTETVNATVDGYGTVISPAGTFTNALRLHTITTNSDSVYNGGWIVDVTTSDGYAWYVKDYHIPVATNYSIMTGSGQSYSASYLDISAGVNQNKKQSAFQIFPNPVTDMLTFKCNVTTAEHLSIHLYNRLGTEMKLIPVIESGNSDSAFRYNVGSFPPGIYIAKVFADGIIAEAKQFAVIK